MVKLRKELGGGGEDEADDEHKDGGDEEVGDSEEAKIDDGFLGDKGFPDEHGGNAEDGEYGEANDEVGAEPVFFLPFVEDDLQGTESESDESEADVVDFETIFPNVGLLLFGLFGVFNKEVGEKEGEAAHGNVDVEDPTPVVVVGNPSAQRGADSGGDDDGEPVDGECHAALSGGESVGKDGLFGRGEAAASLSTLEDAEEEQPAEGRERIHRGKN